ncbi:uncharacterized protein METZ01_LOCUS507205, partial [marine metagenome]
SMYILVFGDDHSKNGPPREVQCALRETELNQDVSYAECLENLDYAGDGFAGSVFADKTGLFTYRGIGHRWKFSEVAEALQDPVVKERISLYPVLDFHEPTHMFEGIRMMSGYFMTKMPYWHTFNAPFEFPFIRDYASPIEASYMGGDFCKDGLLDREGNVYSSCDTYNVDHIRGYGVGTIENFREDMGSINRDSLLITPLTKERWNGFAGIYLGYITSPQQVFINFYDDRA